MVTWARKTWKWVSFSFSGSCIAQWEGFQQGFLHDEFSAFFGSAELRLIFFLWSLVQGVLYPSFFTLCLVVFYPSFSLSTQF
jgi:hypothetical protein